jgi:two-component system, OmpR family, phosphate regulon response regulator OmpR
MTRPYPSTGTLPDPPSPRHEGADHGPASAPTLPRRVCLVEDDPELRTMLTGYLQGHGLAVQAMTCAEDLLSSLRQTQPDLILLDIGLPGLSGLQACQQLRREGQAMPIILLTAHNDEVDRVVGLEMGADDYVGKPFSARELLARLRAALRRSQPVVARPELLEQPVRIGHHTFVPGQRRVWRGQQVRVLSSIEHALLTELTAHPLEVIDRERLLAVSHAGDEPARPRAVDAAVMRLRRLLEPDPAHPRHLLTVRLQGYMFVPDPP